jgi:hypothetical protein
MKSRGIKNIDINEITEEHIYTFCISDENKTQYKPEAHLSLYRSFDRSYSLCTTSQFCEIKISHSVTWLNQRYINNAHLKKIAFYFPGN